MLTLRLEQEGSIDFPCQPHFGRRKSWRLGEYCHFNMCDRIPDTVARDLVGMLTYGVHIIQIDMFVNAMHLLESVCPSEAQPNDMYDRIGAHDLSRYRLCQNLWCTVHLPMEILLVDPLKNIYSRTSLRST